MKLLRIFPFLFFFLACYSISLANNDWELSKDKDGIKIYTRQTETSKIKEFKALTTIKAGVDELVGVLRDIEHYPGWISDIKKAEVLKRVGENELYYHLEIAVPWPMSNRDIPLHWKVIKNDSDGSAKIVVSGKPEYLDEKDGIVRMPKAAGLWQFTPLENGITEIRYQFLGDPGGSIPSWIVNMMLVDGPFNTLSNLKEKLEN